MLPGEGNQTFYYQFDKKDFLQKIYQGGIEEGNIIFSRTEAIAVAKEEYYSNRPAAGEKAS